MATYIWKPTPQLIEVCNRFDIKEDTLVRLRDIFTEELLLGLEGKPSSLACNVTHIQHIPTGEEEGTFLAIDLGGADFRILLLRLHKKRFDMKSRAFIITKSLKTGPGEMVDVVLSR